MTQTEVKEYAAKLKASAPGMFHAGVPVDPAGERVMVRINYNPITRNYTADYHTKEVAFGHRDERGYALLDCDELSEPDPDKLITFPDSTSDKKRKKKSKTKKLKTKKPRKKKKIQAPNLQEPKDNPSSPTTTRIETLADKNLDPSASTASVRQPFSKASEHEKADNKRKGTNKKSKRQATNLDEEPTDNPSSPTAMRIETLAHKNLDSSASTAPEDEKADKKTKKKKTKKIQAPNLKRKDDPSVRILPSQPALRIYINQLHPLTIKSTQSGFCFGNSLRYLNLGLFFYAYYQF
uniref:corepressor interacting with RBPJ 1-like n=1 Tax=Erigeron canadensis TaxID=72917 RepID=UPI001CB8EA9F|nr:corepressor interacting with RBPJ 1-like [Erigeron canadensis]